MLQKQRWCPHWASKHTKSKKLVEWNHVRSVIQTKNKHMTVLKEIVKDLPPRSVNNSREIVLSWFKKWKLSKNPKFIELIENATGYYPDYSEMDAGEPKQHD